MTARKKLLTRHPGEVLPTYDEPVFRQPGGQLIVVRWRRLLNANRASRRLGAAIPLLALSVVLAWPGVAVDARPAAAAGILPTIAISPCLAGAVLCNGGILAQPTPCIAGLLCSPLPVPTPCLAGDLLCSCSLVGPSRCAPTPSPTAAPRPRGTPTPGPRGTPRPPAPTPSPVAFGAPVAIPSQRPSTGTGVAGLFPGALASLLSLGIRGGLTGGGAHLLPWLILVEIVALAVMSCYFGARRLVRGPAGSR